MPPLHLFTLTTWIVLRLFQAVDSHSGYDFPWSLNKFFPLWVVLLIMMNIIISLVIMLSSFTLWDWLFQTECGTYARKEEKEIVKLVLKVNIKTL